MNSFYLKSYLVLERLMMEADVLNDAFADSLRDGPLDELWHLLSQEERDLLDGRRGNTMDAMNNTQISLPQYVLPTKEV